MEDSRTLGWVSETRDEQCRLVQIISYTYRDTGLVLMISYTETQC